MAQLRDTVINGSLLVNKDIQFYYNSALKKITNIFEAHIWNITHRYNYSTSAKTWGKSEQITGTYFTALDGSIFGFYHKTVIGLAGTTAYDNYSLPVTITDPSKLIVMTSMAAGIDANGKEQSDYYFTNVSYIVEHQTTTSFTIYAYKEATGTPYLGYNLMVYIPASIIK
mgnify:FL=1